MEKEEIKSKVNTGIDLFKDKDGFLLKNDISEWAISHKLATFIEKEFAGFDVDCEYNGYAKADNNKKYINILRYKLIEFGKLKEEDDGDKEKYVKRLIYPDIIVHERGKENNLLILEVKKAKNQDIAFDREKLKRYTSLDYENALNYRLGCLVIFTTGGDEMAHDVEWYENGQKL
jgi:hypothetical protein